MAHGNLQRRIQGAGGSGSGKAAMSGQGEVDGRGGAGHRGAVEVTHNRDTTTNGHWRKAASYNLPISDEFGAMDAAADRQNDRLKLLYASTLKE